MDTPYCSVENKKQALGQFFTPVHVADFMAALFAQKNEEIQLLDAGAGEGALTTAFVRRFTSIESCPKSISVVAYELDADLLDALDQNLLVCRDLCAASGVAFDSEIRNQDFLEGALSLIRQDLFSSSGSYFNAAILNPPYKKIGSDSRSRMLLREGGIETSNIYTGFLALAAQLLHPNGELVSITPRSFCNGPYFRPFRERFLQMMSLRRIHVFDSRSAAFKKDEVLQENIVVHAVKDSRKADSIVVSSSSGKCDSVILERHRKYEEVISPTDAESFIHLVADDYQESVRKSISLFTTDLSSLGLEVSTGRVVDFRAKEYLHIDTQDGSVPLVYPCHFGSGFVSWPRLEGKKANFIRNVDATYDLLVPNGTYVLVRRFSTKEERRRIVACIVNPQSFSYDLIGIENHLNYYHARGKQISWLMAKGLVVYLNSSVLDSYFRQFNGHTQVNATDLRKLPYPTVGQLERLGGILGDTLPEQSTIDVAIDEILLQ